MHDSGDYNIAEIAAPTGPPPPPPAPDIAKYDQLLTRQEDHAAKDAS